MIQSRGCLRFARESLKGMPVSRQLLREELQSDGAVEPGVLGLVDDTHAAFAKFLYNPVVRDGIANHGESPAGNSRTANRKT
jgi:hypothetical protein